MASRELEAYIQAHCPAAWQAVQTEGYATAAPGLSIAEKAVIYHYTDRGSDEIKIPVRESDGALLTPPSQCLAGALAKLPPHVGVVYSAELWDADALQALKLAAAASLPLGVKRWPTFLSASKLVRVAKDHLTSFGGQKNCLLKIFSCTGRYIDALSHHGQHGRDPAVREEEVLFLPKATIPQKQWNGNEGLNRASLRIYKI